eukprot:CAMPEP_0202694092 /NCGR_PEP_ID=MMETSP1385-20130828/8044_1 /ASSEMBLY_ACC=CAM_ASM_000861 /TAXON_ID=933848 /ORGANISM="Elphidium margaritaceum" /LENGTH=451 /DNA_ID=CAMNT_0049349873 /DNA_START=23 /DNA_END=1378 /DNA_ORIENTATION=-
MSCASPTTDDDTHDSVTSSMLLTSATHCDEPTTASDFDVLLEKQLLMEKTRVGELANDNQRLLSQNISLCQAIKQQKQEIETLSRDRFKLQQQVSKLFLTVTTLTKTHRQNSAEESETHQSLKNEFQILKNALTEKEATNRKLLLSMNLNVKQLNQKNEQICALQQELSALNTKQVDYEQIIQEHTSSIEEFNTVISEKQIEIDSLQLENSNLGRELKTKEDRIEQLGTANEAAKEETLSLSEKLRNIENLYRETTEKWNAEHTKYETSMKENEWWKSEAVALGKECEYSADKLNALKFEIYSNSQTNETVCIKNYRLLQWKYFAQYLAYKATAEQLTDVWSHLKLKYSKLKQCNKNSQPLQESLKIQMIRSLKDVQSIDLDQLLLCADIKQLKNFLSSANLSPKLQLTVAAQLLPVVENYRIELQQHINAKIDKIIGQRQTGKNSSCEPI